MADPGDTPLRIALIGDFSGRANRNRREVPKPIEIDPENFEDVMQRLGVALDFPGVASLRFRELDDFHPDQLHANLPLFDAIREAKKELLNPRNFSAAAPEQSAVSEPAPQPQPPATSGSLLEQIAAGSSAPAAAFKRVPTGKEAALDQAIRDIGARHATPAPDPRRQEMLATVESVAAAQMRTLLHHPDFQDLEAAWRSVFFLFQQLETGVDLQIHLVDLSRDELDDDLLDGLFAKRELGENPWSLLVGLYTFSPNQHDCSALARLASVARKSGAPFLSAIDTRLFGCQSIQATPDPDDWKQPLPAEDARAWLGLRQSAHAAWVGLVAPRFLLRLPYGKTTAPIESFAFEEMPSPPVHADYLWGNPAIAGACLLAQSRRAGRVNRISGIPVHVHAPGDATPQAEIWMSERLAARIIDQGVMPLASVKHSDAIQLVRFQSIADPSQALPGAW
ncbi:MAG TPA: type VI secretion system contractile sheath large subunit [Bryobacteraceae bacterium]|nr:type VI secretion system contractile sheath large subunit [Bryobacteraceae bacterium]